MRTLRYEPTGPFTVSTRPGWETVITLRGELDLATVEIFEATCESLDFSSIGRVVLDLRDLEFIDACGLRGVLRLHELCLSHAADLRVRRGPRAVQRVFELTGTHCVLPFVSSLPGE